MSNYQLKTPVAFIIFNRPDTIKRVFAEIAKARPPKLLVIADGPRADHPDDVENCAAARAIIDSVDWVFDTVEEAIILEDDCLPYPTFFRFCEELLVKYRDDERIAMISGNNFQFGRKRTEFA